MVDNVVSPSLLLGQGISLGDKTITLIPQNLPDFVQPGMVFRVNSLLNLELMTNSNLFRMELQNTDGEKFFVDVKLPENVKPKVLENNISNYNVKIQAEKVLQLVSNKITPPAVKQEMSVSAENPVVKLDNFSKQFIELPTLKAGQIVEKIMSEINFPPDLKTHRRCGRF